jgi:hypothetical protein
MGPCLASLRPHQGPLALDGQRFMTPTAPVFVDGKKVATLRGATVSADFKKMVIDYIERRYGQSGAGRTAAE